MYLSCPFLPGKIQGYESRSHSFDSNLNVFGPKLQPNCCFWVAVPYCFCIWAWKSYGFYFSSVLLLLITLVTKIPFRLNLHYLYASMPFSFHRNKCRFTQKWALHCRRKKKKYLRSAFSKSYSPWLLYQSDTFVSHLSIIR